MTGLELFGETTREFLENPKSGDKTECRNDAQFEQGSATDSLTVVENLAK